MDHHSRRARRLLRLQSTGSRMRATMPAGVVYANSPAGHRPFGNLAPTAPPRLRDARNPDTLHRPRRRAARAQVRAFIRQDAPQLLVFCDQL